MGMASKTGLPEYKKGDKVVYASQIVAMMPFKSEVYDGAMTIWFDGADKKAHMIPSWVTQNAPEVGGYWCVRDTETGSSECFYKSAPDFEKEFLQ